MMPRESVTTRSFIKELLEFGTDCLKLDFEGSFRKFDGRMEAANWLYVSHPYKIESAVKWGNRKAPFKFSWDVGNLSRSGAAYRGRGFDTYLFSAEGHGGGNCPITFSLLSSTPARAGYVVIHEGWHSTLRKQQISIPYELEEATGRAVGCFAIIEFARKHKNKALLEQAINQEKDWANFAGFINRWHRKLSTCYRKSNHGLSREKDALIKKASAEALTLRNKMATFWEKKELEAEMNNAFFLRYHSYTLHYPDAARIVRKKGNIPKAANIFKSLALEKNPVKAFKNLARGN